MFLRRIVALTALATALLGQEPTFEANVGPIFKTKCVTCHGGATPEANLDLGSETNILKGGDSGPAVVVGSAAKSLLLDKVVTGQMPPEGKNKLTESEVSIVRAWIDKSLSHKTVAAPTETATEHEVRGILQARCIACHGSFRQQGGLDLRTVASRLKGGKSGPALIAGKPEESLLYKRILDGSMPPDRMAKELAIELPASSEIDKIRTWIAAGAPDSSPVAPLTIKPEDKQFWAFQPPVRPVVPTVKNVTRVKNPIDAFLLNRLEKKNLSYAAPADKLALMRRVSLDLTGLPPTQTEIAAYQKDIAPGAYERLVDRLLASPHYGERWGQHWLDLAGYSDSEGFGQDDGVRPYAWRYRDYVIRSLNADKPYTLFLTEQIAGDEMSNDWKAAETAIGPIPDPRLTAISGVTGRGGRRQAQAETVSAATMERLSATGFLRTTPDQTNSHERSLIAERMNIVAQEVEVLTSAVMGLTVGCARCHDHKYDPIPQRDHYRLSAILQGAYDPYEWKNPKMRELPITTEAERKELEAYNAPFQAKLQTLQEETRSLTESFRKRAMDEAIAALSDEERPLVRAVADTPVAHRTDAQKALAQKHSAILTVEDRTLPQRFSEYRDKNQELQRLSGELRAKLRSNPHVRILADNPEPSVPYLLRRGDPTNFGEPVDAGVPRVLENPALKPYQVVAPFPGTSGRRLALAQWLTQPNHPLTARVAVNQLWMRHFGRGIVPTVANFGRSGLAPTHPELLDWLATEFVARGWSMKAMHRLMVTSDAYRQSTRVSEIASKTDPDNELLSRMTLRRMDAETLYDSLVSVAGRLDPTVFGYPGEVSVSVDKEVTVKPTELGYRRAIYALHRRQTPMSLLDAFDQPAMTPNCTERRQSNVATQALHMMNSAMTWELSRYLAGRAIDQAPGDVGKQIEILYLRTFTRRPTLEEITLGRQSLEAFRKQWSEKLDKENGAEPRSSSGTWLATANYVHALLNSAEFSFID